MSPHATLFLIGFFLAALPFLGFPHAWDSILVSLAGVLCTAVAFLVRGERQRLGARSPSANASVEVFVENTPPKKVRRTRVRVVADVTEPHETRAGRGGAIPETWRGTAHPEEQRAPRVDSPPPERVNFSREREHTAADASV